MSNRPKRERARRTRREEMRTQRRRARTLRRAGLGVMAAVIVGGAAWYFYAGAAGRPGPVPGEREVPAEGAAQHVAEGQPITPTHYPPSSGPHYASPAAWGVYSVEVPEGAFVHSLEHSGIVILYNCPEGCPEVVAALTNLYDTAPESKWGQVKMVVSPNSKIDHKIYALAWGREVAQDELDVEALRNFYIRWVDRGPEDVP